MLQQDILSGSDFKVAVLISGRGSNLDSLRSKAHNYRILEVISNNPEAPGLQLADSYGLETRAFPRTQYASTTEQKEAIFSHILTLNPDLVCLAGFMLLVPAKFTAELQGRIVNIHPSLLPAFPGLDTHKRVIAAEEKVHGCSVHFVDAGMDTGPLIASASLELRDDEDEKSLGARVLSLEHQLYPWVVNAIAVGGIRLTSNGVVYLKEVAADAARLNFRIFGNTDDV